MCDEIAIINHGKIIACEPTRDLLARLDAKQLIAKLRDPLDAVPTTLAPYAPELVDVDRLILNFAPSTTPARQVLSDLEEAGLTVDDFSTKDSDLEDIFVRLTQDGPKLDRTADG